jgi:hypothetical protein
MQRVLDSEIGNEHHLINSTKTAEKEIVDTTIEVAEVVSIISVIAVNNMGNLLKSPNRMSPKANIVKFMAKVLTLGMLVLAILTDPTLTSFCSSSSNRRRTQPRTLR